MTPTQSCAQWFHDMSAVFVMYSLIFYFGAIWGSFFYTLALRFSEEPAAFSLLFERSKCPSCGNPIRWIFLIPLFGYFFSQRRCAYCGVSISPMYPLMEIAFGLIAVFMAHRFGIGIAALNYFLISSLAVSIAIADIKTMTIPSALVYPLFVVSAYPAFQNYSVSALESLGGMILLGVFFFTLLLIFPGSFGGGDIRFAAALGLATGLRLSVVLLETALISGAVVGILYGLISKKGIRIKIPFAPFLAAGLLVALLFGREILDVYYRLVL